MLLIHPRTRFLPPILWDSHADGRGVCEHTGFPSSVSAIRARAGALPRDVDSGGGGTATRRHAEGRASPVRVTPLPRLRAIRTCGLCCPTSSLLKTLVWYILFNCSLSLFRYEENLAPFLHFCQKR